jgi:VWFA-related protein
MSAAPHTSNLIELRRRGGDGWRALVFLVTLVTVIGTLAAQAGRRAHPSSEASSLLNVTARRADGSSAPIASKDISLFDNGVEQSITNFSLDPSPARIVLLVDNSLTIRADVEKLEAATLEFAYEIFDGDKLLIVGYDNSAEIVSDWTDNARQITAQLKSFRKQGDPHLFDALTAVIEDALRPLSAQKRTVVVISDGLDRGSRTKFEDVLSKLQELDITVYAVQAPDRTRGAIRRDVPKPKQVVEKLVEGTGGLVFPIDKSSDAAKTICDELRKNRYVLSYLPQNVLYSEPRRLLIMGETGISVRAKAMQPPE